MVKELGDNVLKIGVVGLGFVGLTLAVALASKDFDVIGVDIDRSKIEVIRSGKSPFYEKGLDDALKNVINRKLRVSTSYMALKDADIVFIAVGTPPKSDGSQDQTYIIDAIRNLAMVCKKHSKYRVIVIKSTVLPGTTRKLAEMFSRETGLKVGKDFGIVMNPEFLREGNALYDTFYPSRVVVGCIEEKSCKIIVDLWTTFYNKVGIKVPILTMSLEEAELVKYASNVFLAMRISYANTIANICEKTPNCDVVHVLEAVGFDPRIGRQYLRPGLGYGGSCLPKDVKALIHYSKSINYEPVLLKAIDDVNEKQPYKAIDYLMKELGDLNGKVIGILGLAFKPNTDDIREAVSIKIIKWLLELGATIKVHDPMAMNNVRRLFGDQIIYCKDPLEVIMDSDGVIIVTEWEQYKSLKPNDFKTYMKNPIVIDGRRIYDPDEFIKNGIKFYAIGLYNSN